MTERRLARRYDLCLPVMVRSEAQSHKGTTRDISTRGVYFTLDERLAPGCQFDFTLTLPAELTGDAEVFVHAHGRVVRVEVQPPASSHSIGIAAVIEKYDIIRDDSGRS